MYFILPKTHLIESIFPAKYPLQNRPLGAPKGRLSNADLSYRAKFPVFTPARHYLTDLIIIECHAKVCHNGLRDTLVSQVRTKFWIIKGRQRVKSVIHNCVTCKRHERKGYQIPPTAALPDFRVTPSAPFDQTACDLAGPLFCKTSGEDPSNKCHIALFTCCATRSVHLKLVADLTAECFIRCFRRFSARRGLQTRIVSDNARTFKTADRKLAALFDLPDVQNYLLNQHIKWRYNLPKTDGDVYLKDSSE